MACRLAGAKPLSEPIGPQGTNFSENLIEIYTFYWRKCSSKCRQKIGGHFVWPQCGKLYSHSHKYTHKNQTRIADHSYLNRFHNFMQKRKQQCRFYFNRNSIPTDNTNQTANINPLSVLFIRGAQFYQHSLSKIRAGINNWIYSLL